MAACAICELSPVPYHLINIILHLLACLAVLWIGWELFPDGWVALGGALLFAVHPMHTEGVAGGAGITALGAGLFYFISIGAYLHFRRIPSPSRIWLVIASLAFLCSLFYKEMALTL